MQVRLSDLAENVSNFLAAIAVSTNPLKDDLQGIIANDGRPVPN
jgi:hypothetical protein